jgi:hypothetical protein
MPAVYERVLVHAYGQVHCPQALYEAILHYIFNFSHEYDDSPDDPADDAQFQQRQLL